MLSGNGKCSHYYLKITIFRDDYNDNRDNRVQQASP